MAAFQPVGELFVHMVTHPKAWRGFLVYGVLIGLLALALWRGRWAEQRATGGMVFHFSVPYAVDFIDLYWPGLDAPPTHLATDLAFLVVYLPLVVRSRRIWPLWFYAFNLLCPLSLGVMLLTTVGVGPFSTVSWIWMWCAIGALSAGVLSQLARPAHAREGGA